MRKIILNIFLPMVCSGAVIVSCNKDKPYMSSGVIAGWNNGYCMTCGGFYLNLSGDTSINANTSYVVNYSPSLAPLVAQLNKQFDQNGRPIHVFIDWQPLKNSPYPNNWIFVTDMKIK